MPDQVEPLRPRATQIQLDLPRRPRRRPSGRPLTVHPIPAPPESEADLDVVVIDSPPLGERTEFWNTVTHCGAAVLAVLAGVAIVLRLVAGAAPVMQWLAGSLYALSLVYLYAASGLSHWHSWRHDPIRRGFWRRHDQVGIIVLAVTSFAPLAIHAQGLGRLVLPAMAMLSAALLVLLARSNRPTINPLYLAQLGWLPPLAGADISRVGGSLGIALALGGGLCYIGGLAFLFSDHRRWWCHPVWHLFTVTGSGMHYAFIVGWCL